MLPIVIVTENKNRGNTTSWIVPAYITHQSQSSNSKTDISIHRWYQGTIHQGEVNTMWIYQQPNGWCWKTSKSQVPILPTRPSQTHTSHWLSGNKTFCLKPPWISPYGLINGRDMGLLENVNGSWEFLTQECFHQDRQKEFTFISSCPWKYVQK